MTDQLRCTANIRGRVDRCNRLAVIRVMVPGVTFPGVPRCRRHAAVLRRENHWYAEKPL